MKSILIYLVLLLFTLPAVAQKKEQTDAPVIYISVEEMPEFPGGNQLLGNYVAQNFNLPNYPTITDSLTYLYVSFVIGPKGEVYSIENVSRVHPLVDQEAVRIIKSMPTWKPGRQDGEPVYVKYTVPLKVPAPRYVPTFLQGKSPFFQVYDLEEYESGVSIAFIDSLEYPGGSQTLNAFIQKQYKPTKEAIKESVNGTAKFSFLLNHKGEVSRVRAISQLGFGIEENLVDALKLMPKWEMRDLAKVPPYVKRTMEVTIINGKATFKGFVPSNFDRVDF